MKRSFATVRQGCSAGPLAPRLHQTATRSTTTLFRPAEPRFHTYAIASYPSIYQPARSNHNLNPATSSTTRNEHPLPIPSTKKRSPNNRPGNLAQTRSVPQSSKEAVRAPSATGDAKQAKVASTSKETSSAATGEAQRAKGSSTSAATRTSTSEISSWSTSQGGKKPEPPKTLLDRIKGLWESLKYLFRFYYEGVKQIWRDRGIVADLRKTIAERENQGGEGVRWIENAVIKQHQADLKKLPLFLAILLILEEVLPLVVIYAPSLLPSTCVLPSQSTKMRSEEERLRGLAVQGLSKNEDVRKAVRQIATASETKPSNKSTSTGAIPPLTTPLESESVRQVAQLFALSARGPTSMVSSRITRHLQKVQEDDDLLRRALQSKSTSSQWKEICQSDWLWKACAQRGLRAFEAGERAMEQNLVAYLHLTDMQKLDDTHRSLLPLALYDGTLQDLFRLQEEFNQEHSKGIRLRTKEVVEEVKETEKKKETN